MSTAATFSSAIHEAMVHPRDLLTLCRDHGLQLDWNGEQCLVHSLATDSQERFAVPFRKSLFRAILARVAVLCNERRSNSVSPYGGEGELSVCQNQETVFRVSFVNTPDEQRITIAPVQPKANGTV